MSARIRGKETALRLAMEGQDQEGSFLKVRNFTVSPRNELVTSKFVGEARDDGDSDFSGYDVSFEIEELDSKAEDVLDAIDAAQRANQAPPRFVITEQKLYRQVGQGAVVYVYHPVTLVCEQITDSNGSSYVGSKWKGFSPDRDKIAA
jgi:hypothetical protein